MPLPIEIETKHVDVARHRPAECPPLQQVTNLTGNGIATAQSQFLPELHGSGMADEARTGVELVDRGAHRPEHTVP